MVCSALAGCYGPAMANPASAGNPLSRYLMEPEGSRYSEYETAARCLATWHQMRA